MPTRGLSDYRPFILSPRSRSTMWPWTTPPVLAGTSVVELHGTTACDLFTLDQATFPSTTKLTHSWSTTHRTSKQLWPLRKVANAKNSLTSCSTNYLDLTSHQRRQCVYIKADKEMVSNIAKCFARAGLLNVELAKRTKSSTCLLL